MHTSPCFSIVMPVLNEAAGIAFQLGHLLSLPGLAENAEIIVVDGGSTDKTCSIAATFPVRLIHSQPGRARQMNAGARQARNRHLFFIHADSIPPRTFVQDVLELIRRDAVGGCYRLAFDDPHPLLRLYAWFTRFDVQAFRYGDQGLYVPAAIFHRLGGFNEDYLVMEDNDMVLRLRRHSRSRFQILPAPMITSARRYHDNGILRLQLIFAAIYLLHNAGIPHAELKRFYKDWITGRPVV